MKKMGKVLFLRTNLSPLAQKKDVQTTVLSTSITTKAIGVATEQIRHSALAGRMFCGCTERKDLKAALYAVVLENFRAGTEDDIDAYMDTIHSAAPAYQQTEQLIKQLFATHDLKYEIYVFRYIEQDGDYAIARLEFYTTQVAGPEFKDNRLDTFHIFRKEKGQWKMWSHAPLTVKYL